MADRNGYIGRAPGDSSVTIARRTFTPTTATTDFTFTPGYVPGYIDVFLNGAKLVQGDDYVATNGSLVQLSVAAQNGDAVELVAYKAFNIAYVDSATGNFDVGDNLTVGGSITAGGGTVTVSPDGLIVTGIVTSQTLEVTGNATITGNANIAGVLTYEDVTSVDSIGIVTARSGLHVGTGTSIFSPDTNELALYTNSNERLIVDASGNINIDSGGVYYDATNNRLAVGTTSPGRSLHVAGGSNSIVIERTDATTSALLCVAGSNQTEIYSRATNSSTTARDLVVHVGSSEALRVDTSNRLLVGTSSVTGTATAKFQGNSFASTSHAIVRLSRGVNNPANGNDLGIIQFSDSSDNLGAQIYAFRDAGTWTSGSSHPTALAFSTTADGASSPTERYRINSSGTLYSANNDVRLGTEGNVMSGGGRFTAHGDFYSGTAGAAFSTTNNTNGAIYIQFGNSVGTKIGSITRSSSTSVAYNTTSDYRLKENVLPLQSTAQLVKQLNPVSYNFIGHSEEQSTGFIAHELQEFIPEAVTGEKDATYEDGSPNYQGVDLSKLVPVLTAALQEALAEIESLKARVTALEP